MAHRSLGKSFFTETRAAVTLTLILALGFAARAMVGKMSFWLQLKTLPHGRLPAAREAMMQTRQPTESQLAMVQRYLEGEFPGQAPRTWWHEDEMAQVFEIQGEIPQQLILSGCFFQHCSNCVVTLKESELAEYIREATTTRRFIVKWENCEMRVRSKSLATTDGAHQEP